MDRKKLLFGILILLMAGAFSGLPASACSLTTISSQKGAMMGREFASAVGKEEFV